MSESVIVDVKALARYLKGKNQRPEVAAPWAVVELAFNALVAAGVIVFDDGPFVARSAIEVGSDGVTLRTETETAFWIKSGSLPPYDGLIASLAYHLATTLNEPPTEGPWPKQFELASRPDP